MHEVALNLFATDGAEHFDIRGSAVLIGPGLALTARHNVEIFRDNFEKARHRGETRGELQLLAVQTWQTPAATIIHRVSKWFAAPWTDLAILRLHPAADQRERLPRNFRWRAVTLDMIPPAVGDSIATFGFDEVTLTSSERTVKIAARAATSTGVVVEVLEARIGNPQHGWPRFQTNACFLAGMSGGPVMRDGRVCGIVSTSFLAQTDDEDHASFAALLWPAMAIEIDDPRVPAADSPVTLLELARTGFISAHGHENVEVARSEHGQVVRVGFRLTKGSAP